MVFSESAMGVAAHHYEDLLPISLYLQETKEKNIKAPKNCYTWHQQFTEEQTSAGIQHCI
jgi:hypothetical protein